jgi:hypothetical protein
LKDGKYLFSNARIIIPKIGAKKLDNPLIPNSRFFFKNSLRNSIEKLKSKATHPTTIQMKAAFTRKTV